MVAGCGVCPGIVDCQPATVRKHREMNPGASDAIEVLEPDDGGLLGE
jgi:hypothetical protein